MADTALTPEALAAQVELLRAAATQDAARVEKRLHAFEDAARRLAQRLTALEPAGAARATLEARLTALERRLSALDSEDVADATDGERSVTDVLALLDERLDALEQAALGANVRALPAGVTVRLERSDGGDRRARRPEQLQRRQTPPARVLLCDGTRLELAPLPGDEPGAARVRLTASGGPDDGGALLSESDAATLAGALETLARRPVDGASDGAAAGVDGASDGAVAGVGACEGCGMDVLELHRGPATQGNREPRWLCGGCRAGGAA